MINAQIAFLPPIPQEAMMIKAILLSFAFAGTLISPLSAQTTDRFVPFVGLAGVISQVPQPFSSGCGSEEGLARGVGGQLAAGVRMSARFDVQTRYTTSHNSHGSCLVAHAGVPVKRYGDDVRGTGLQTVDVQGGFSPSQLRMLRLSAGFGLELQSNSPFLVGGIAVRLGQHTKFVTGVDVMAFRTRYIMVEEEYDGFQLISRTQTGDGLERRVSWMFRVGAEIPLVKKPR